MPRYKQLFFNCLGFKNSLPSQKYSCIVIFLARRKDWEIGMGALMVHGLSYRRAMQLLGFNVHGNARGSGQQLITKPGQVAAPAPVPAAPAPRRISAAMAASVGLGRPSPAAAAAAIAAPVRRRIGSKQPGTVRP